MSISQRLRTMSNTATTFLEVLNDFSKLKRNQVLSESESKKVIDWINNAENNGINLNVADVTTTLIPSLQRHTMEWGEYFCRYYNPPKLSNTESYSEGVSTTGNHLTTTTKRYKIKYR